MSRINVGRVIAGGLVAGLVYNLIDFVINGVLMTEAYRANFERLGIDAATMEAPAVMATWVAVDFLLGILVVWLYAAIRPRFGPGPKTAAYAGLAMLAGVTFILFGFAQMGVFDMALILKGTLYSLVNVIVGAMAGAAVYKE